MAFPQFQLGRAFFRGFLLSFQLSHPSHKLLKCRCSPGLSSLVSQLCFYFPAAIKLNNALLEC